MFVALHFCDEILSHRHVASAAELIVDSAPRQCLALFEEGEQLESLSLGFIFPEQVGRFEQGARHATLCGARADDVSTNTVDAAVEEVEAVMHAVECSGANNLVEEFLCGIVHERDMVGVPSDGAADVQQQLGHEGQHGRDFVGRALGGVVVAGVDGEQLVVLCGIGCVEVVAAYGEAFESDSEDFAFDAVFHHGQLLAKDLVERLFQQLSVFAVSDADVLATVVNPEVHDAGVALCFSHSIGDATATAGVFNPEIPDIVVGICQGEVSAFGMRERGAVEVERHVVFAAPFHPRSKVRLVNLVAVNHTTAEVGIDLVQTQPVLSGDEALGLHDVGSQLVDVPGLSRVVSRALDASS